MNEKDIQKKYKLCQLNKKKAVDDEFIGEIKGKDSDISNKIIEALNNKGIVFGYKNNNCLKAIYIFKPEADSEDTKKNILNLSTCILTDEIDSKISDFFETELFEQLSEFVAFEDYSKVVFNDKEIVPKTVKIGNSNVALGGVIFALCTFIGILFFKDNWYLGMCIGLCLGAGSTQITKKKK